MDSVFDNLSLAMGRKTKRIINYKKEIDELNSSLIIYYCSSIFFALLIFFLKDYYHYLFLLMVKNNIQISSMFLICSIILFGLFISIYQIYSISKNVSNIEKKLEFLRLDIIDSIDNEFCIHEQGCSCKDEYILKMDKKGIDVVFK